jgi:5-(carboxyamino)imidazole ribonucleotide synthase
MRSGIPRIIPRERPCAVLGIIGGGQLAKMTALAAYQLGCEVVVLEVKDEFPANSLDTHTLVGDWNDPEILLQMAGLTDVITLENEFVESAALAELEKHGHLLHPGSACIGTVQDKLEQKMAFAAAGLPVPRFADAPTQAAVLHAAGRFGWPLVLKKRKLGYDGKGNATIRSADDLPAAWARLDGDRGGLMVEEFCRFAAELAVIVTRGRGGGTVVYPVVETVNRDHICHVVKAPAQVPPATARRAADIARGAVGTVGGVGSMGMELFLLEDGGLLVNEIAPRVHNTGHYTIEACECSQFENHVRAVLGFPLGSTRMRAPAAVMVNLLGAGEGLGTPHGAGEALAVAGAHVHVYGKQFSAKGRKMGHVTALGASVEEALATAARAAGNIRFGDPA